MIKIYNEKEIINEHYQNIKMKLKGTIKFYLICLEIREYPIKKNSIRDKLKRNILHGNTQVALYNKVSTGNRKIQTLNELQYCLEKQEVKKYHKQFKSLLKKFIDNESMLYIEKIITESPTGLLEIHNEILKKYNFLFNVNNQNLKNKYKPIINEIFNYGLFSDKYRGYKKLDDKRKWNAYALLSKFNIKVCPYCNRQHINTVESIIRPDIDHYLPQSQYPFFALSFHNLIPSCKQCNSSLKNHKHLLPDTTTHPYLYINDDQNISIPYFEVNIKKLNIGEEEKLKKQIVLKISKIHKENCKSIANSEFVDKMEKIYSKHNDIVAEILSKCYKYTDEMLEEMVKNTNNIISKKELSKDIFNEPCDNYEVVNTIYGKLRKDIITQYKSHTVESQM